MSLLVRVTARYILVRDEARPSADECVRCPSGSYSTEKATYPTNMSNGSASLSAIPALCDPFAWIATSSSLSVRVARMSLL
jgi:hypothetical protein